LGRLVAGPPPARTILLGLLRARPWRVPPDEAARELRAFGRSQAFQAALLASVGTNTAAGVAEITVPVRIVFGTRDLLLGVLTAPRFAAAIPGAELVPLPGVGHVPMADDPPLVAEALLGFTSAANAGAPVTR
jgi:pimeloyl-ACP methyl ester carboxylesterase